MYKSVKALSLYDVVMVGGIEWLIRSIELLPDNAHVSIKFEQLLDSKEKRTVTYSSSHKMWARETRPFE